MTSSIQIFKDYMTKFIGEKSIKELPKEPDWFFPKNKRSDNAEMDKTIDQKEKS